MIFDRPDNLSRHVKICSTEQEEIFIGVNIENRTLFQRLEEVGYVVPKDDRFYPYTPSFDFESLLVYPKI